MTEKQTVFTTDLQEIELSRVGSKGRIIDIGGGGEGLVSRIEGSRVCAVDIRLSEIREAQIHDPKSNWFLCDGRKLCFQTEIFDIATLWFSFGYLKESDTKQTVLEETYRVLKTGGTISIIGSKIVCSEDVLIFKALFTFPDGTQSQIGYGVKGNQGQTSASIIAALNRSGFKPTKTQNHDKWFHIQAVKI
ncbi:MAG: class I SAM-dependent methyltransferase [Candidatus Thorarchaeota archaeon]